MSLLLISVGKKIGKQYRITVGARFRFWSSTGIKIFRNCMIFDRGDRTGHGYEDFFMKPERLFLGGYFLSIS